MRHELGRPTPARAIDARTLYLATAARTRVTSTGEALVVATEDGGAQRIPINRIQRIVSNTRADWSGAALALCMERGVPLVWVNGTGSPLGSLWSGCLRSSELGEELDLLAADCPHWPEAYGNWLRRERMRVLKAWAAQRQLAARTVTTDEWLRAKQSWVYRGEVGNVLPQAMRGLAGALVAARLAAAGLKPRYWAMADAPIELLADLEYLIWAGMNLCAGPLAAALDRPAEMAAIFERGSGRCADTLHGHVLSLRSLARRVLDG